MLVHMGSDHLSAFLRRPVDRDLAGGGVNFYCSAAVAADVSGTVV